MRRGLLIAWILASASGAIAADGPTPAERVAAAHSLESAKTKEERDKALPPLLDALADASPDVRTAAAGSLSRIGDERALPRLAKRLTEERDEVALAGLLLAVGALGKREEVPLVGPFAAHAAPRIRAAAATALGSLGGLAAAERLRALLEKPGEDPSWAVRGAVFLALGKCGTKEDAGTVFVAYREGKGAASWFARACLAKAIALLDDDPVPTLDRLVADDDPRVSSAAAMGFVLAKRPLEVERRLDDPRPGVRAAVAAAVGEGGLHGLVPKVLAMATGDASRAVRWSAALSLSLLDVSESDGLLIEGLRSDDAAVWTSALVELQRKTANPAGRDAAAWRKILAERRAALPK